MFIILCSLLSFADTTDVSMKQNKVVFLPNTSLVSEEIYAHPQWKTLPLPTNHTIESNHYVRNTCFALGTLSFSIFAYIYRQANHISPESTVAGTTSFELYEQQKEEYAQIRKRYWFSATAGMAFWTSGLTLHFLERAEKQKMENNTKK